jgi:hypothetical protein
MNVKMKMNNLKITNHKLRGTETRETGSQLCGQVNKLILNKLISDFNFVVMKNIAHDL